MFNTAEQIDVQKRPRGNATIKAIDFFCGAGGLTRGLLDAGIDVVAGVDNDKRLQDTYESNNKPSRFIEQDIAEVDIEALRSEVGIQPADTTLYAACTPCQPFSTLNRSKGKDDQKALLLEFAAIIAQSPPDFVIVENVPGLNNAISRKIYHQFEEVLAAKGFGADARLLDAKHFGVPQTRKRFILIGSRHGVAKLPAPTTAEEPPTVRDHIGKYPSIRDGEESLAHPNHIARPLQPHHRRIVEAVPLDGGSRRDIADKYILLKCHQDNPDAHKDVFGRMAWDEPSPTLTCRCTDVYCGRFTHPDEHRGISLREAAALQTFADDYEFFGGSFLEKSRQIGNAVPVRLAEELGNAVIAHRISSTRRYEFAGRGDQAPAAEGVREGTWSDRGLCGFNERARFQDNRSRVGLSGCRRLSAVWRLGGHGPGATEAGESGEGGYFRA